MRMSRRRFLKGVGVATGAATFSYFALKTWEKVRNVGSIPGARRMKDYDRVILLGIDGLDPQMLQMLIREGTAPHFARLWQGGCGGALQSVTPAQSPVVWTTLATGTNPGKHGVFDFIHRDPNRPSPFLSICQTGGGGVFRSTQYVKARQNAALWNILSEQDVPVTVIRWPVTFPAEEINGRMLAGLGVPSIRGTLGHYTVYTDNPSALPDVPPERMVHVHANGARFDTIITGPMVRGLTKASEATIPMAIRLTEGGVSVEVAGQSFKLAVGRWSDWIRLKFSVGPMKSVSCIVKFHLIELEPMFKLYMAALEPDPEKPAFRVTEPEHYAADLSRSIGEYHTLGMPEDTKALNEHVLSPDAFAEQCNEITEERRRMFWHEFKRFDRGLFAFVFDTSDRIQHMFWRENSLDRNMNVVRIGHRIREHYLLMDQFVGELLDAMDSHTALLLVSDHGFTSFNTSFDLNAWLTAEGFMTLKEDPRDKKEEETALYNLMDWSRTVAYGCGFSSLYFNLKGREGHGIVDQPETDALARKVAERMTSFVDPDTGVKPVVRVSRREEIYDGPQLPDAPDMIVSTRPGYRMGWQTAIGGVCTDILSPNEKHWSGDHIVDPLSVPGTILSNLRLNVNGARAHDVAPTALALLGLEPGNDCDGRVLGFSKGA